MNKNDVKAVMVVLFERLKAEYGHDTSKTLFKEAFRDVYNKEDENQ